MRNNKGLLFFKQKDEVYLNLVLEFVPETVYRASRHYAKLKQVMPMLQVKLYMYQVSDQSRGPWSEAVSIHYLNCSFVSFSSSDR